MDTPTHRPPEPFRRALVATVPLLAALLAALMLHLTLP